MFYHHGKWTRDIGKTFKTVCKKDGIEGKLYHSLRHKTLKNLTIAGVQGAISVTLSENDPPERIKGKAQLLYFTE